MPPPSDGETGYGAGLQASCFDWLRMGLRKRGLARLERRAIAFGETVAFLSSVIPAQAGIQRPKTRHSPLDSRLRGNDGNREVGEPKCDCPGLERGYRESTGN